MNPTILIVEDEHQQREVLSYVFEGEGFGVVGAESAEEGLEHIDRLKPDMIVTDVKLTGMDGFTFFDRVRTHPTCSEVPFVFITGYNDRRAIERVKTLGASGYVTKPYELEDLVTLVKSILSPPK